MVLPLLLLQLKSSGDGYVDGLQFSGVNYFLNVSKELNDAHKLSFNCNWRTTDNMVKDTTLEQLLQNRDTEQGGKRFNPDWGYRNGEVDKYFL